MIPNWFIEHRKFLLSQVGNVYVYGAEGQVATEAWIKAHTTATREAYALNIRKRQIAKGIPQSEILAWDCSGLPTEDLMKRKIIPGDMNANGMKGKTKALPKKALYPGCLVFRVDDADKDGNDFGDRAHHVGTVVDIVDGKIMVVHARSSYYGVMLQGIDDNGTGYWEIYGVPSWVTWTKEDWLQYEEGLGEEDMIKYGDGVGTQNGLPEVKEYQLSLMAQGFSVGSAGADGKFGNGTLGGHHAFQAIKGLPETSAFDVPTQAAMLKAQREGCSKAEVEALKNANAELVYDVTQLNEKLTNKTQKITEISKLNDGITLIIEN